MYLRSNQATLMRGCPSLSKPAKGILQSGGGEVFKRTYGTHFVYGILNNAMARSSILVETRSETEKKELSTKLTASYSQPTYTVKGEVDFMATLTSTAKSSKITTKFISSGVKGSPNSTDINDIATYLFNLKKYVGSNRNTLILLPHSYCDEYQTMASSFVSSSAEQGIG